MDEKVIHLIFYSDGSIAMPNAVSVGEARAIFAALLKHAEKLEEQINALPLQRNDLPEPPATPE